MLCASLSYFIHIFGDADPKWVTSWLTFLLPFFNQSSTCLLEIKLTLICTAHIYSSGTLNVTREWGKEWVEVMDFKLVPSLVFLHTAELLYTAHDHNRDKGVLVIAFVRLLRLWSFPFLTSSVWYWHSEKFKLRQIVALYWESQCRWLSAKCKWKRTNVCER